MLLERCKYQSRYWSSGICRNIFFLGNFRGVWMFLNGSIPSEVFLENTDVEVWFQQSCLKSSTVRSFSDQFFYQTPLGDCISTTLNHKKNFLNLTLRSAWGVFVFKRKLVTSINSHWEHASRVILLKSFYEKRK